MHTTSRDRPGAAPPPRRPRLLGTYPVPELHLVGAPDPGQSAITHPVAANGPRRCSTESTTPSCTARAANRSAGRTDSVITVRITEPATPDMHAALDTVVAELRALTKLDLATGEPAPASLVPPEIPAGEIHVRYLTASKLAGLAGPHGSRAGLGVASRCTTGCCYVTGFAFINADHAGPDATTEHALAILRHELAHVLGLGHAARPSSLMHRQLAAGITRYGRGDQHGLALLGQHPPFQPTGPGHCHQDAANRGVTQASGSAPGPSLDSLRGNPTSSHVLRQFPAADRQPPLTVGLLG